MSVPLYEDFDRLEDLPVPRERTRVVGHLAAQEQFLDGLARGRLHHAWLLSGAEGIGKATLALNLAQYILRADQSRVATDRLPDLETDAGASKVRHLSHPDFVYVRRSLNPDTNKLRQVISVADVRYLSTVFGSTSGVGGWRVAVIDAVDDLNESAANALLKVLEEPPERTVFLIVCHAPAGVLPTIRSRCRKVSLAPLSPDEVGRVVSDAVPDADPGELAAALSRSEGSVRRALILLMGEGLAMIQHLEDMLFDLPKLDFRQLHTLGDRLSRRTAHDDMTLFLDTIAGFVAGRVRGGVDGGEPLRFLSRLGEVEEDIRRQYATSVEYNLDLKSFVIASITNLAKALQK